MRSPNEVGTSKHRVDSKLVHLMNKHQADEGRAGVGDRHAARGGAGAVTSGYRVPGTQAERSSGRLSVQSASPRAGIAQSAVRRVRREQGALRALRRGRTDGERQAVVFVAIDPQYRNVAVSCCPRDRENRKCYRQVERCPRWASWRSPNLKLGVNPEGSHIACRERNHERWAIFLNDGELGGMSPVRLIPLDLNDPGESEALWRRACLSPPATEEKEKALSDFSAIREEDLRPHALGLRPDFRADSSCLVARRKTGCCSSR